MSELIHVHHNHPPMIHDVFDREYLAAQREVFEKTSPSKIIGAHRWMGTAEDRAAGARFTAKRLHEAPEPGRVIVTNGTQSALVMLFSGLVGRGGVLLTETLTYPPLLTFARHFGFEMITAPIDEDGLIPDKLREIIKARKPKALYAVPTFQNPTTSIMPTERRKEIAAIAREFNLPIIEDDIYSLVNADLPPPLSFYAPELSWYVLGTAKSIAAGLKIAYVVAPTSKEAEQRFWPGVRGTHWMATPISAAVATALVGNGGADRIIDAVASEVRERQSLVKEGLAGIEHVTKPEALHVWFELPAGMERQKLVARAGENGILIGASDQYVPDGASAPEAVRMGIGNPKNREQLVEVLDRFARSYREARS